MKYFTTAHWLVVVLIALIVGVLFGGGIIYFWPGSGLRSTGQPSVSSNSQPNNQVVINTLDNNANNEASTNTATGDQASAKVPSDWLTHTDATTGISFSYPPKWGAAKAKKRVYNPNEFPAPDVDETLITFKNLTSVFDAQVQITSGQDYLALANQDVRRRGPAEETKGYNKLLDVYKRRAVTKNDQNIWLPASNAGLIYYTPAKYIENANGSYRGLYYFSFIAQNDPFFNKNEAVLTSLTMILTDGKDNVVQFSYTDPAVEGLGFDPNNLDTVPAQECLALSAENQKSCRIDQKTLDQFKNSFSIIADSLK